MSGEGKTQEETLPDTVAGANGEEDIAHKFREVYATLYNSAESGEEMAALDTKIKNILRNTDSKSEVDKITGNAVKTAISKMKPEKQDVSCSFSTDAILHGPDILFEHLAAIFRSWLYHGNVTKTMLSVAFLPLLKGHLKDPADTASYRAIAGSSLILKLFKKTMLLMWLP
jgi:hypothetical protein